MLAPQARPRTTDRLTLAIGLTFGCLALLAASPKALAQTCEQSCSANYDSCRTDCDNNPVWTGCSSNCDSQYNDCVAACPPSDGGGDPGTSTGDGHVWCDGWDRQGDCALNHLGVSGGAEMKRLRGTNGYDWQTFLTWNPAEFDGFGRFGMTDGNVGVISTSPVTGQVPLYRWSTRRGFYYSTYYTVHTNDDYVYGGIAGYVWPAGTNLGYPLYQFYSQEYGHFYTNYPSEIKCQPPVSWAFQGEMARVNWPAPIAQANRVCYSVVLGPFPPSCDPFVAQRCYAQGRGFDFGSCTCF